MDYLIEIINVPEHKSIAVTQDWQQFIAQQNEKISPQHAAMVLASILRKHGLKVDEFNLNKNESK